MPSIDGLSKPLRTPSSKSEVSVHDDSPRIIEEEISLWGGRGDLFRGDVSSAEHYDENRSSRDRIANIGEENLDSGLRVSDSDSKSAFSHYLHRRDERIAPSSMELSITSGSDNVIYNRQGVSCFTYSGLDFMPAALNEGSAGAISMDGSMGGGDSDVGTMHDESQDEHSENSENSENSSLHQEHQGKMEDATSEVSISPDETSKIQTDHNGMVIFKMTEESTGAAVSFPLLENSENGEIPAFSPSEESNHKLRQLMELYAPRSTADSSRYKQNNYFSKLTDEELTDWFNPGYGN